MWEVLSQGLNARVDDALTEVSDEKQRSHQLIQRQLDNPTLSYLPLSHIVIGTRHGC